MMKLFLSAFAAVWLFCLQALAAPSDTTAEFDAETGFFVLKHHTVEVARANFVFWAGQWGWRGPIPTTERHAPFDYGFSGTNEESGLAVKGSAGRSAANRMEWRVRVEPGSAVYGGLSIKFDLAAFAGDAFVPQLDLLPGREGWSLKFAAGEAPVKFVISPAPSDVSFERGQKGEVRVYLAKPGEELAAGDYTMTLELPAGGTIETPAAERLAQPDMTWYNDLLEVNISPVDLSFLNAAEKPAGKHGQLGVAGDRLVFADGEPARFWGANLGAYALFNTGLSDTVNQAKRLSKLGFNLVRMTHTDSDWVTPNILGAETAAGLELDANRCAGWTGGSRRSAMKAFTCGLTSMWGGFFYLRDLAARRR